MSRYPEGPGHRGGDTDAAAAEAVAVTAATYERMSLALVMERPRTADEVHAELERRVGHPVGLYSVRPRLSALKAKGLVADSGERRLSSGGRCKQRVLRATTAAERALFHARKSAEDRS